MFVIPKADVHHDDPLVILCCVFLIPVTTLLKITFRCVAADSSVYPQVLRSLLSSKRPAHLGPVSALEHFHSTAFFPTDFPPALS